MAGKPAAVGLDDLIPDRSLCNREEGPNQFPFTADRHPGKTFEPLARGHLGILIEPDGEVAKLAGGNFALLNPVEQMLEQGRR